MRIPLLCTFLFLFFFSGLGRAADQANSILSLSHYDEVNPDFAGLTRAGVLGVIHEATFPAFDHDPKYVFRQNEAARAGMLWGAYHFGNSTDAKRQADHFLDFVQENWRRGEGAARPEKVLLVLDAERNTHYPGGSMDVSEAVRFIERVHDRTGVYPGLYSNENWIKRMFANPALDSGSKRVLGNCWLWIANYHYVPVVTTPWAKWMLWQYTGDGTCELPRSRYPVDVANLRKVERTIFSGSRSALKSFWNEHSWRPQGG
jgi:lysozyme